MKPTAGSLRYSSRMKALTPTRIKSKPGEALKFVDLGREHESVPDVRARLQEFYRRHPQRALKPGERGIVESLKADRDRR